jgi:lipopolysaccharide export system protein LptA
LHGEVTELNYFGTDRTKIVSTLFCILVFLGTVFGMHQPLWCAQAQEGKKGELPQLQSIVSKESPIQIASDKLEASQKNGTIVFEGHVVARQDNITMTGKKLTIFAVQDKPQKNKSDPNKSQVMDRIDRIELEGEVKITQDEKTATCDKAVYYREAQKIVLFGNPRVAQGKDVLQGQLITLYLLEERSVVEGAAQRPVQATIYPSGKKAD